MTSYLQAGWYDGPSRTRLRTEVIDGAMDVAGVLLRVGVPARRVLRVALKVRSLVVIADPLMHGSSSFGARDRDRIARRLELLTDGFPELQGFINDCLEHVESASEMTAFYLHLVHVARMMQLLAHAVGSALDGSQLVAEKAEQQPQRRRPKQRSTKKPRPTAKRRPPPSDKPQRKTTKKKRTPVRSKKKSVSKKKKKKKKKSPRH